MNTTTVGEAVDIYTFTHSMRCLFHMSLSKLVIINLNMCVCVGGGNLVMDSNEIELCQCIHVSLKLVVNEVFSSERLESWTLMCGGGPGVLPARHVSLC